MACFLRRVCACFHVCMKTGLYLRKRGDILIEIQNLKKVWSDGKVVLDDINLTIEDGDIYALVGRSGAGKSTLLRCINGLASYNDGHILLDGKEGNRLDKPNEAERRSNQHHIHDDPVDRRNDTGGKVEKCDG